jgi:hypothetical protein
MDTKNIDETIKDINNRLNILAKTTHDSLMALTETTTKLLISKAVQDVINMAVYETETLKRDKLKELLSCVTPQQTSKLIDKISLEEIQSTIKYLCSPSLMTPEERRKRFRLVAKDDEQQDPKQ